MDQIGEIIRQLENQRSAIERALIALRGTSGAFNRNAKPGPEAGRAGRKRRKRNLSPEGRARIAEAARRRWTALRAGSDAQSETKRTGRKKST